MEEKQNPQLVLSKQYLTNEPIHNESNKNFFTPIIEFCNSKVFGNVCTFCFLASFMIGLFLFMHYYN